MGSVRQAQAESEFVIDGVMYRKLGMLTRPVLQALGNCLFMPGRVYIDAELKKLICVA
jgi:hypothetical protein